MLPALLEGAGSCVPLALSTGQGAPHCQCCLRGRRLFAAGAGYVPLVQSVEWEGSPGGPPHQCVSQAMCAPGPLKLDSPSLDIP